MDDRAGRAATAVPWESRSIVGMRVDATTYEQASRQIADWAKDRSHRYVCIAAVNNVIQALDDPAVAAAMAGSDLTTSDGMPLVWALRRLGVANATRVYGPSLTESICQLAATEEVPIGLYGGTPEVLEMMSRELERRYPGLVVVYSFSPPFREPSAEEHRETVSQIAASDARIVFVGLGCPRQELWMHRATSDIPAVLVGVGAAFDFIAGVKRQAPEWMQAHGLEWLFRLVTEPRRLWRRYLYGNPRFMVRFLLQLRRDRRRMGSA